MRCREQRLQRLERRSRHLGQIIAMQDLDDPERFLGQGGTVYSSTELAALGEQGWQVIKIVFVDGKIWRGGSNGYLR